MTDSPRHENGDDTVAARDRQSIMGTPRWVKVFGTIISAVVLLVLILLLTRGPGGRHGPSRHAPSSGDAGDRTPTGSSHR